MKKGFFVGMMMLLQGCVVEPSLTYNFSPDDKISAEPLTSKIVVMYPADKRGHPGTTPVYEAFIPFVPFKRIIEEPEYLVYTYNGFKFNYEEDFAKLVSMDLNASGIASTVATSPSADSIQPLFSGPASPDYIVKLDIQQLDWQAKYTMYCLSIAGYVPQLLGYPNSYGFSFLKFSAEVYDSQGKIIATKSFTASESQNGWLYYYSGYLRALTRAYGQISPDFRQFIANTITESNGKFK